MFIVLVFLDLLLASLSSSGLAPLRNYDHVITSVFTEFAITQKGNSFDFNNSDFDYSCGDCDACHNNPRNLPWENIFAASKSTSNL